jgi:hypothetical protein
MSRSAEDRLGLVGVGAAACVACCAGPILAFLGGLSVAGLVSAWLIGGAGLLAGAAAGTLVILRRRNRIHGCTASCTDACTAAAEPQAMAGISTKGAR